MLARINRKDLAERAKKMKAFPQTPPAQDLKIKVVTTATPTPTEDDEETYYGPVLKRRRRKPVDQE